MTTRNNTRKWDRAIVIGGSIAGKLAARVLSDYFNEVVIIEKDAEINSPQTARNGVPQAVHGHALLKSGEEILEKLFPGIIQELIASGSVASDFAQDISWYHHGSWKMNYPSEIGTLQQSRPFLEYHLHCRVNRIENIRYIYEAKVKKLLTSTDHSRILGVVYQAKEENTSELKADIVVDAAGAASLTPKWLKELELPNPEKTEVKIDLQYASRLYQTLSPMEISWKGMLVYPNPPEQTLGGGIYQIEDGKWMVTLLGYGLDKTIAEEETFLKHAQSLDHPIIFEVIKDGVPISEVSNYRFPKLRRFHYEKHKNLPNGLIVIGDAFCRIDPIFAQGMSLSALEAMALKDVLEQYKLHQSLNKISKKAHQRFSKILMVPWLIALVEDFRFKNTAGKRFLGLRFMQSYIKKVVLACATEKDVYNSFIQVLHLKAHPVTLFSPKVLRSVLFPRSITKGDKSTQNEQTFRT